MVLFHDDKKELTKGQKRRRLALRIVLILVLLFCISLWVLGIMGGPHVALKQGLEDYLSETTGMETSIGEFDGLYFFPTVRFEGGDIKLKDDVSDSAVHVGRLEFESSFWDLFFMRSKMRKLKIENMSIRAGLLSTAAIKISDANLKSETSYDQAGLVINGHYGSEPFSLFYEAGYDGRAYYIPDDTARLFSSLGHYELNGRGGLYKGGGIRIKIDKFGTENNVLNGHTILIKKGGKWSLEFEMTNGHSAFEAKLVKSAKGVTGTVVSNAVHVDDFIGENSVKGMFDQFLNIIEPPSADDKKADELKFSQDINVAIDVTLKKIMFRNKDIGHLSFPLKINKGVLNIESIKGSIMEGAAKGNLKLDTQKDIADFVMTLEIDDLKYGSENLEGRAVFDANLTGAGHTLYDLKSSLDGNITFIGGKGKLESRALDIWGGGLINSMLPNFNPETRTKMNCFVADFAVKNGKAKAEPFFMDTDNLTLVGTGVINIADETIDFALKPKTKDISLIDVAFPVNISGDLADPSILPDPLGVGKKIGGLFIGSMNPAFFALNVAKLGFMDQNPCSDYSGENIKEVLESKTPAPLSDPKEIKPSKAEDDDGLLDFLPDIEPAPEPKDQYQFNN